MCIILLNVTFWSFHQKCHHKKLKEYLNNIYNIYLTIKTIDSCKRRYDSEEIKLLHRLANDSNKKKSLQETRFNSTAPQIYIPTHKLQNTFFSSFLLRNIATVNFFSFVLGQA